jgi:hypothetical protein
MGNIISGAALKSGMAIENYALCNAAVAAMCYDPKAALRTSDLTGADNTPDFDTDPMFRKTYGLENQFNNLSDSPTMFNFVLPADTALGQWKMNNFIMKPELSLLGTSPFPHEYSYAASNPTLNKLLFVLHQYRSVSSISETMAYISRSKTRAAGATKETGGAISGSHSMDSWLPDVGHAGFGDTHSAQWRWNTQSTNLFWKKITEELELHEN